MAGTAGFAATLLAACSGRGGSREATTPSGEAMSRTGGKTFVLVHAAWLGAWSWEHVTSLLTARGHRVVALDLPGHGQDRTPPASVTMADYVETVVRALDAEGPAVLVGHSMGGLVISQAAEARPDNVQALVYVSGFLLPSGASFAAATEGVQGSLALENLVFSEDGASVTVRGDILHEAFAHDVSVEVFETVRHLLVPEPTAPLATPLALTDANWGRVPRYYVECLADRAIPPPVQRAMYSALPVKRVFSIDTSHSPNFAAPEGLAGYLHAVAQEV